MDKKACFVVGMVFIGSTLTKGCSSERQTNAHVGLFPLPAAVLASAVPDDGGKGLKACVEVREKGSEENTTCREMEIAGDSARLVIEGLSEDQKYIVNIRFSFHSGKYGEVLLATTEKEITVNTGTNRLRMTEDAYQYPDDDGDGWNNIRELERDTHPKLVDELLNISRVSPGNLGCPYGGLWVETGIDGNTDGILDPSEVSGNRAVCSSSSDPLWRMEVEWAHSGANCPEGGLLVRGGADANSDGNLRQDETTRVRFVCDDGLGWQGATLIGLDDAGDATEAQVALNDDGRAVAVWQQRNGAHYHVMARHFSPDEGWGAVVAVETNEAGSAFSPQVAMDDAGNVLVVWQQSNGVQESIWANRFVPAKGWGKAMLIENNDIGPAVNPRVVMNESGEAIVVWRQNTGGDEEQIWASRFVTAAGWSEAVQISGDSSRDGWVPDVAISQDGSAVAVWVGWHDGSLRTWARHYTPGKGWGVVEPIGPDLPERADSPRIAMNDGGEAMAVWEQLNDTRYDIWSNRFIPGEGWGNPGRVGTGSVANASSPRVAIDGSGNAIVVWQQSDSAKESIWAIRFEAKSGWGDPARISSGGKGVALSPRVAVAPSGEAVAAWIQSGEMGEIWATRFVQNQGWGTAELISIDEAGSAWHPELAGNGAGTVTVVWHQGTDERGAIWGSRFHAR